MFVQMLIPACSSLYIFYPSISQDKNGNQRLVNRIR
jgi:hypothetical protein